MQDQARPKDAVEFHPLNERELSLAQHNQHTQFMAHLQLSALHRTYACGACGDTTNGRVLCEVRRRDDSKISWCWCSCDKSEPTVLIEKDGMVTTQLPLAREFHASTDWPTDLAQLYEEASKAYSASAYTASSMICRKLLMACACDKGADDGEVFAKYVDYITTNVLAYPAAKTSIDAIRAIGNEANHHVQFVNQADAMRSLKIVTYMLNTIYSLPTL